MASRSWNRAKKRAFDITVCVMTSVVWIPLMAACAFLIWYFEGRPIFYVSERRVLGKKTIPLLKFRTMVRHADKIANRNTVPIDGVRFLNLSIDSPLYTRIGRSIERFHLTELPQILHIVRGHMTFIGNRPLPENVIACLKEQFPQVEDRFLTPSGLTGPVQLAGRSKVSDQQRLQLEIGYCRFCSESYSVVVDCAILARTVFSVLGIQRFLLPEEVFQWMGHHETTVEARRFGWQPRRLRKRAS